MNDSGLDFLMEAHNGLSAKIVEETGFKGIWASGLSVSAALGVRDSNEASWTQVLEQIEFMADSVNIPILLDGDTGYGNFNNARRLITKLESRGVAGVCLEDKLFPKTNSFIDGELQPLADINEFCGKIMACKDTQVDPDFCVVARLEAFITGYGKDEALKRAEAYRRAGADAILVHSKKADDTDICDFMAEWDGPLGHGRRCPVVIVPTKYWSVPTEKFDKIGVSTIIWANHNMRAAVKTMQATTQSIYETQSLAAVESGGSVVPVSEVFRLQNTDELKNAEKRYEDIDFTTVFRAMDEVGRPFPPFSASSFLASCASHRSRVGDVSGWGGRGGARQRVPRRGGALTRRRGTRRCDRVPRHSLSQRAAGDPQTRRLRSPQTHEQRVTPERFFKAMQQRGTSFFAGVPDSLLKNFCDYVTDNTAPADHVISANEGTAVGMAAGHHLATGKIPVVYLQNSGLGNIVNPVLSLADPKVRAHGALSGGPTATAGAPPDRPAG